MNHWLQLRGIKENDRVASKLNVKSGWELAVDTVLSRQLNAISVQKLEEFSADLSDFKQGRVWLVDQSSAPVEPNADKLESLANKVNASGVQIDGWFQGVYVADSVADALDKRHNLSAHESIVTREGCWIGTNWASFGIDQAEGGVLQRCLLYTSPSPRD